jgi:DNA invertase Pin-like site-specific DNA recombinase
MKRVIYVRVSTASQGYEAQLLALQDDAPGALVYQETASGVKRRPVLDSLIEDTLQTGDELHIYSLDRLGRRTVDVLQRLERIKAKGIVLKSKREKVDCSTPIGQTVCELLVSIASLERELISERTVAGLAAARAQGRVGGRRSESPMESVRAAMRLVMEQGWSVRQAAQSCGVHESRVRYHLRKSKVATTNTCPPTAPT